MEATTSMATFTPTNNTNTGRVCPTADTRKPRSATLPLPSSASGRPLSDLSARCHEGAQVLTQVGACIHRRLQHHQEQQ